LQFDCNLTEIGEISRLVQQFGDLKGISGYIKKWILLMALLMNLSRNLMIDVIVMIDVIGMI
jgi:hypothetical protein